jgi:chromosome partitioning protein
VTLRRIAFINEKGGTCKTTLAVNTAAWFAQKKGKRVLLVDLDTQGHAGKSLGIDVRTLSRNVFHWLTEAELTLGEVVRPTAIDNLQVVPSYKQMADFPLIVATHRDRDDLLKARMAEVERAGYDLVVFDAPPSLGLTTTNILLAATEVVVPVATTYLSLDGCAEMAATVRKMAEGRNPALFISLVVPTLYRKTALADEIIQRLEQHFPGRTARLPLALNVAIDEAQSHGKTIWEYAPWSRGATLLQAVAETVERLGTSQARKSA